MPENESNYTVLKDRFDSLDERDKERSKAFKDYEIAFGKQETALGMMMDMVRILQDEQKSISKELYKMAGKMAVWGAGGGALILGAFELLAK